jgi:hypothetical protein
MFLVFVFIAELLILFFLSKTLTSLLFAFFHKLTRNNKISIYLMSFLFLPGTLIHEISHAAMAVLLFVPVEKMEFWPQLNTEGLKLGSVKIAKTDPIRRVLIGSAPFLFGTAVLIGVFFYAVTNNIFEFKLSVIVISYLAFEIGNTMFSSKKDLEGALELILTLTFIIATLYFAGLRVPEINPNLLFENPVFKETFQKAVLYLTAPIGIDLILISILKLLKINSRSW